MKDGYGRDIYYLRLSVTDLCNLRCVYCMPAGGVEKRRHEDVLTVEELEEIARSAGRCGIRKIRLTGGEPLVRRGIVDICARTAAAPGVEEVCMTTNGLLLPKLAPELRKAGLRRVNISLDTLSPELYRELTRVGNIEDAVSGLKAALDNFETVKINAVLIGGTNEPEIRQMVYITKDAPVELRFIELMPIGECAHWPRERFLENSAVLEAVPELEPCGTSGVARLFSLPNARGRVGLISPLSSHFCPECNRIRITPDGRLKPCLHSAQEIELRGFHGAELDAKLREGICAKPMRHHLSPASPSESLRGMSRIGG
ncbi:MAG TPA: GTP 3',8-cyclase MoaA [Candidatus Scatomorpha merdavium]|nr:GTP 3',8-cyclase MoaA [Oscillospiraceae bacterium]HIS15143.1 GTP 3',8-cyclase MoaA [Candidatus Scatomorpha merdavium]